MQLDGVIYRGSRREDYPFSLPLLRQFHELHFEAPLTIFVGENGSGKSTLLEGIAALVNLPVIGSGSIRQDESLAHARELAKALRPVWTSRPQRGFFLRAEDFFGFVRQMNSMRKEMLAELAESERQARERGASEYAVMMSKLPWQGQIASMESRYGEDLDAASHGESFLQLLQARVVPDGLYLLDEPEAALSPMRQLALLAFFKQSIEEMGCQFILASHSPILLAYPQAQIMQFDEGTLKQVRFDDLEHVRFTRDFLQDPQQFLRFL